MVFAHPDCPFSFENASVSFCFFSCRPHVSDEIAHRKWNFSQMMAVERSCEVIVFEKGHLQMFTACDRFCKSCFFGDCLHQIRADERPIRKEKVPFSNETGNVFTKHRTYLINYSSRKYKLTLFLLVFTRADEVSLVLMHPKH